MEEENILDKVLNCISNFGWWLFVSVKYRKNKRFAKTSLTKEVRDNLGYFLKEEE
jgi:hypothetical protein